MLFRSELARLSLIRAHYDAWLACTSWSSLEEVVRSKRKKLKGREVIESRFMIIWKTGIDALVLEAIIAGDLDGIERECEKFSLAFGDDGLPDGAYTKG